MRTLAASAAVLALALSAPAMAQDAGDASSGSEKSILDGDYLAVGVGVGYAPSYEGSDDYVLFPVPLAMGSIQGVKISPRNSGLALDFIPDPKGQVGFNLGVSARLRRDRTHTTHDPVVDRLGRLHTAIELGPTVGVTIPHLLNPYDSLTLSTDVRWDVNGAYKGMAGDAIANYMTPLSRAALASLSFNLAYGDDKFADYYYSITPAGTLASGLPTFKASGGFHEAGARLLLGYDLDGNLLNGGFAVVGAVGYQRVLGDARRSPVTSIRGSANQWFAAIGIGYNF